MWVLCMEVSGSNSGKHFQLFCAPILPRDDCSITVSCSMVLHFLVLLNNFVAVTLLLLKLSKGTAAMISLCTH